jgi:hypothetical protein
VVAQAQLHLPGEIGDGVRQRSCSLRLTRACMRWIEVPSISPPVGALPAFVILRQTVLPLERLIGTKPR